MSDPLCSIEAPILPPRPQTRSADRHTNDHRKAAEASPTLHAADGRFAPAADAGVGWAKPLYATEVNHHEHIDRSPGGLGPRCRDGTS